MKTIEVQIEDLGDLIGHTLWVKVPADTSAQQKMAIRDKLRGVLPYGVGAIVGTDDMIIEAIADKVAKGA